MKNYRVEMETTLHSWDTNAVADLQTQKWREAAECRKAHLKVIVQSENTDRQHYSDVKQSYLA